MLARLRFVDNDGASSTCQTNLPAAIGAAAGLAFVSSWRPLVAALSSAMCVEADLVLHWSDNSTPDPSFNSDVFRHGAFIFETAVPDLAVVRIPSIDMAMVETTGPFAGVHIDQALVFVQALVDVLTNGVGTVAPCDPFGNDLVTLSSASVEQL